jgi:uncharacterized protein (TIGR00661 family)
MANILYGVNGEGAGHSTRAKEVITHLQQGGHRVHVVSFDRGLANLRKDFEVTEITGWHIEYVNNQVRYRRTIAKNLLTARKTAASVARLKDLIDERKIDVVVTDFEPLSCHAGRRKRLLVISIDNRHCLTNTDVTHPSQYRRDAAAAKMVTRLMVPRANAINPVHHRQNLPLPDPSQRLQKRQQRFPIRGFEFGEVFGYFLGLSLMTPDGIAELD